MTESAHAVRRPEAQFSGLRMTADEFFDLPEDGYRYELVHGVVVMSPSPTPRHQAIVMELAGQIHAYLRAHPVGQVLAETDMHLGAVRGRDLVYRPEIVFLRTERWKEVLVADRITGPPDLAVEVISPGSRRYDSETKREDYERFGVAEYWLVDPERSTMTFYVLEGGRFVAAGSDGETFASRAVPDFVLDLARVRALF